MEYVTCTDNMTSEPPPSECPPMLPIHLHVETIPPMRDNECDFQSPYDFIDHTLCDEQHARRYAHEMMHTT